MSKNITIQEGGVARTLSGVEKIVTNVVGGGTQNWIPEDEAANYVTTGELSVSENGTYNAADDGYIGYSSVEVNVEGGGGGGGEPVLIEKTITENGTYNASDDDADGYSSVEVNVEGATIPGTEMQAIAPSNITKGSTVKVTQQSGTLTKISDYSTQSHRSFLANNKYYTLVSGKITIIDIVTGDVIDNSESASTMLNINGRLACAFIVGYTSRSGGGYDVRLKVIFNDDSSCYLVLDNMRYYEGSSLKIGYANNILAFYYGKPNQGSVVKTYSKSGELLQTLRDTNDEFANGNIYPISASVVYLISNGGWGVRPAFAQVGSGSLVWIPWTPSIPNDGFFSYVGCDNNYFYMHIGRGSASQADFPYEYAMYKAAVGSSAYAEPYKELVNNYPRPDYYNNFNAMYKRFVVEDENQTKNKVFDIESMTIVDNALISNINLFYDYLESGTYLMFDATYQKTGGGATMVNASTYPKDGSQVYLGFAKDNVAAGATGTAIIVFS